MRPLNKTDADGNHAGFAHAFGIIEDISRGICNHRLIIIVGIAERTHHNIGIGRHTAVGSHFRPGSNAEAMRAMAIVDKVGGEPRHIIGSKFRAGERVTIQHHLTSGVIARHIHPPNARIAFFIGKSGMIEIDSRINDTHHHILAGIVFRQSIRSAFLGDLCIGGNARLIRVSAAGFSHSHLPHPRQSGNIRDGSKGHIRRDHIAEMRINRRPFCLQHRLIGTAKRDKHIHRGRSGFGTIGACITIEELLGGNGERLCIAYRHSEAKHHHRPPSASYALSAPHLLSVYISSAN